MNEREAASMLWPSYALRAWLTAMLGALERADSELDARIESHEKEIVRLRSQKQRSETVVLSLREALTSVDNVLRQTRDKELSRESRRSRSEVQKNSEELKEEQRQPSGHEADKRKR